MPQELQDCRVRGTTLHPGPASAPLQGPTAQSPPLAGCEGVCVSAAQSRARAAALVLGPDAGRSVGQKAGATRIIIQTSVALRAETSSQ